MDLTKPAAPVPNGSNEVKNITDDGGPENRVFKDGMCMHRTITLISHVRQLIRPSLHAACEDKRTMMEQTTKPTSTLTADNAAISPEVHFPLPALDLLLKHLVLPSKEQPTHASPSGPNNSSAKTPPSQPILSSLGSVLVSEGTDMFSQSSLSGFSSAWRSPNDAVVQLSLVCRYFRDVIWRKRLTVTVISAKENLKRLEECVGKEYRDAVR